MKDYKSITVKLSIEAEEKLMCLQHEFELDANILINRFIIQAFGERFEGEYIFHKTALELDFKSYDYEGQKFIAKAQKRAIDYMKDIDPQIQEIIEKYQK